jgi:hypothetical protein
MELPSITVVVDDEIWIIWSVEGRKGISMPFNHSRLDVR